MYSELKKIIEQAWENRELLSEEPVRQAVRQVVELVDKGQLRTAEPVDPAKSEWKVNEWVKKAVILYFRSSHAQDARPGNWSGTTRWRSSTATRSWACASYRTPWRATAPTSPRVRSSCRRTSTSAPMSTRARWSTRGPRSAPAPRSASTSTYRGGVGIGGVLEPVQAAPVIIEDNCFIGSRSIVVEGAHVCREAVLGSNTVITGSTHIIDVTGPEPVTYKGYVPPRSVVVPGSYRKQFPAGEYSITCALIIGQRKESTDKKTSLNDALRDFGVSV